MASPEANSLLSQLLIPSLEKIISASSSWRKANSKLSHQCKSLIHQLSHPSPPSSPSSLTGPLHPSPSSSDLPLSFSDSESILSLLISALSSSSPKIADPALDVLHKLISHNLLRGEADPSSSRLLSSLLDSACSTLSLADHSLELLLLKTLLSAVTSTSLRIHGDALLQIVRSCYDLFLLTDNPVNQITAKATLIQMLVIVFRRMEADSSTVPVHPIVVAELMDPVADRPDPVVADANMAQFVQGFISKVIVGESDAAAVSARRSHDGAFETRVTVEQTNAADLLDSTDKDMLDAKYWEISMYKTALEGRKDELGAEGAVGNGIDEEVEVQIGNKLRRDAFLVFRALCKLSMKTPPKEAVGDPTLMRGKIVALELLKILLENAGAVFRTSDR